MTLRNAFGIGRKLKQILILALITNICIQCIDIYLGRIFMKYERDFYKTRFSSKNIFFCKLEPHEILGPSGEKPWEKSTRLQ